MITVVLTSCGRWDKLKKTYDSFRKFNTYPIEQFIVIEDGPIDNTYPLLNEDVTLIVNNENIGQVASIDKAYSEVKTEYIFHCENDWLFYRSGFVEQSLAILKNNPGILQVWLREQWDTNTHPVDLEVYETEGVQFRLMSLGALGGNWHGFSWNPGLRRTEDYALIAPFTQYLRDGDFAALTECRIGQEYYRLGFRAAILMQGYTKIL